MKLSFSDLVIDTDRKNSADAFLDYVAALDFKGQDMESVGRALMYVSCDIVSPLEEGLKAEMNAGSEAFIAHLRDKQYHLRGMIEFLHIRLHLTAYIKDNDDYLMRLVRNFEVQTPTNVEDLAGSFPMERQDLIALCTAFAEGLIAEHDYNRGSVAKAIQDVACACLAISGVDHRKFLVLLKVQARHLKKLHQFIGKTRYGMEDFLSEKKRMHKTMK